MGELTAAVEENEPGALAFQYFYSEADDEVAVFEMYGFLEKFAIYWN